MPEEVLKKNKKRKKAKATAKVSKKKRGDSSEGSQDDLAGLHELEEDGVELELMEGEGQVAHLVVVNLQKTHVDERATLVVHARCDDVMKGLCDMLGITITIADANDIPIVSSTTSSSSSAGNIPLPSSPSSSSSTSIQIESKLST